MLKIFSTALALSIFLGIGACHADTAKLDVMDGMGPNPQLPEPEDSLFPTVNIAPAKGWPQDEMPIAAEGLKVQAFADNLEHPRWIYVLPNGDVLVAESDKPAKPTRSIKGWVQDKVMKVAGSGTNSADRITLLRDTDKDGVADERATFLRGLHSPFGMALIGDDFYVANSDAILKFPYETGVIQIDQPGRKLTDLPAGEINYHWTKSLLASPDGQHLYVGVGSNSNIAEKGMEYEVNRAAVLEVDVATGDSRVFASGLRNPVGMDWQPNSQELWVAVNERDELGSDLVPDYMTSVQRGDFFGWPYSYYGQKIDTRVEPQRPDLVEQAIKPDYALGPHTASLGLAFYTGNLLPEKYKNGVFIGQHGSWNRNPPSGYKVIYIPFSGGQPNGMPEDVLTGFLSTDGDANGRPVGVTFDKEGALLVADDVGDIIWRVSPIE